MSNEEVIFEEYKLPKRKITDKQIVQIQQLLIEQFGELIFNFYDGEIIAQIPEDKNKKKPLNWDELSPENQGQGWTIRDAILSLITCKRVLESLAKEDIRYFLMNKVERLMEYGFTD